MTVFPADLLSAFGESILLLDDSRCVVSVAGETSSLFGCAPDELIGAPWAHLIDSADTADSLYWLAETAFEEWTARQFLPAQLPFKDGCIVQPAMLEGPYLALRIKAGQIDAVDNLV